MGVFTDCLIIGILVALLMVCITVFAYWLCELVVRIQADDWSTNI